MNKSLFNKLTPQERKYLKLVFSLKSVRQISKEWVELLFVGNKVKIVSIYNTDERLPDALWLIANDLSSEPVDYHYQYLNKPKYIASMPFDKEALLGNYRKIQQQVK